MLLLLQTTIHITVFRVSIGITTGFRILILFIFFVLHFWWI